MQTKTLWLQKCVFSSIMFFPHPKCQIYGINWWEPTARGTGNIYLDDFLHLVFQYFHCCNCQSCNWIRNYNYNQPLCPNLEPTSTTFALFGIHLLWLATKFSPLESKHVYLPSFYPSVFSMEATTGDHCLHIHLEQFLCWMLFLIHPWTVGFSFSLFSA